MTANKRPGIAVLGECMVELRPDKSDGRYSGASVGAKVGFGGDTLNTSIYLARQGIAVEFVTALGDDPLSDWMLDEWRAEGVGSKFVRRDHGSVPGLYLIDVDGHGERSFYYWRANSPASRLLEDEAQANDLFSKLHSFACLYLSGITLAIYSSPARARLVAFLQEYRQGGGKVFFDNNYRPGQWSGTEAAKQAFEQLYRLSDIALPTFDDEHQLYSDATAETVVERLQSWGVPEIVLKNGADGCTVVCGDSRLHVPTTKVEKVVDTTAAGDSFNAGYLAARLDGAAPEDAAANGNRIASLVVQHRGAIVPSTVTDTVC